jgi:hypothetical protein
MPGIASAAAFHGDGRPQATTDAVTRTCPSPSNH